MKFYNGHWEMQMGVKEYSAKSIYEYTSGEDYLELVTPTSYVTDRGGIISVPVLTIRITNPAIGVFRVESVHFKGAKEMAPVFPLNIKNYKLTAEETENEIVLHSGGTVLKIDKETAAISLYHGKKKMTEISKGDLSFIRLEDKGLFYQEKSGDTYMRAATALSVDEHIYGLGERFGPFIKNGQSIEIYNEDGGTSTDLSYKNIPFFLSDRGYGVFVNHPEPVSFEVGSDRVEKTAFSVKGEKLDFFLIDGPTMKEALEKYTSLTGKPALPPEWSFGLWLSTSFLTNYDEDTVMSIVDRMEKEEIPLRVFHFDCYWMKGFHWTNFLWDEKTFPDPEGMLKRLKSRGLHICVWINPYIAGQSELFCEGMEKGYFIHRKNGDVWQSDMWQAGIALVDFTNPEAGAWYQSYLEKLLDMGVDCFKTDFGERIPIADVTYYDGSSPEKMHNYYSYLYNEAVFETVKKVKGEQEAVLFARSATAGGQKFPVHWGGDCLATYESMAESLRGGLSLTMSGFGYWSHDIGGFEDTSSPDVYKRWVAFGLLSTHSRLHGSCSYRVPWVYDEESVEVLKFFTKVKEDLMPYLLSQAEKNHETGIPLMRAMVLEFPEDPVCPYLDKQYMLGDDYLVAPVFHPDGTVRFYLPEGKWKNYFTREEKSGPVWVTEQLDYFQIPLWKRN